MQLTHEEITRLSAPEHPALVTQPWDSLSDEQLPLMAAQRDELDRRLEAFEHDHAQGYTWDTLKAEPEQRGL